MFHRRHWYCCHLSHRRFKMQQCPPLETREDTLPHSAFGGRSHASNNSADLEAARHVYTECQQSQIPTTTISQYAAYGCPISISFLDCSGEIQNANFKAMWQLWRRVNISSWIPGWVNCLRDATKNGSLIFSTSMLMIQPILRKRFGKMLRFSCMLLDGKQHSCVNDMGGQNPDFSSVGHSKWVYTKDPLRQISTRKPVVPFQLKSNGGDDDSVFGWNWRV